jgi:hypothetical protein
MSTLTQARPSLQLTIGRTSYDVAILPPDRRIDPTTVHVYRLSKADGATYDVTLSRTVDGPAVECTCADYRYRRAGLDSAGCKHVKGLRTIGLLS